MANAFNIDKGGSTTSDTHLINETFHVFSKSPGSPTTSLGGARLKSGHTTTTSDVWADEIPAFFKAATQAKFDLFSTKAVKDDLCLFNGNVYQHNGTEFVSLGTEAEVLVDGATFKKNDKDVVKFHKGRTAINLTADNNNGDGSNDYTAKIYDAATGSTTFVPQFISAMDKMVDGIPSLAYDAAVFASGSQLAEGLTADNDYICNAYAGVIQFNKARSSGVTVNAWEYIGDKLNTTISELATAVFGEGGPESGDASLTQKVAQNTAAIAKLNGPATETGSVAKALADAKGYTDSKIATELADGGSIAQAIASAKQDAIDSAKVTLTQGEGIIIPNSGTPQTSFEVKVDTSVIATVATVTAISEIIASNKSELDGKIATINETIDALTTGENSVSAQITNAITAGIADGGVIDTRIDTVISNATATVDSTGAITKAGLVTAADADKIADKAIADSLADTTTANALGTAIADAKKAGTDAATAVGTLSDTVVTSQSVAGSGITVTLGGKVGAPTLTGSVTTASYTAANEDAAGSWTDESNVVTGATVKAALADVASAHTKDIETLNQAINGLTTTGLTRRVLADNETLASITEPKANVIYLVKDATSETGAYVEYLYVGDTWEAIGTTSTDLAEYAKSADIEALDADLTVNGISVKQVDGKVTELTDSLITASVPADTTSVEGNVAYVGSTKHVIAPEKFQTAAQMPSTLTSWVADLSNLTVGDNMFKGTALTTFIGDLSSLTSGVDMFVGCSLTVESVEFIADTLPTVTSGTIALGTTTEAHATAITDIQAKGWTVA